MVRYRTINRIKAIHNWNPRNKLKLILNIKLTWNTMRHWIACKFGWTLANRPMVFSVAEGTTTTWIFKGAWVDTVFVLAETIVRAVFVDGALGVFRNWWN